MALPTRDDINVFDSLDEQSACEHFFGKDLKQAETMFQDNSMAYQEDLMWMGPRAFRYYIEAAKAYVENEDSANDSSFISALSVTLAFRAEHEPMEMAPISRLLAGACHYILENWDKFRMIPEFYAPCRDDYIMLEQSFSRMAKN